MPTPSAEIDVFLSDNDDSAKVSNAKNVILADDDDDEEDEDDDGVGGNPMVARFNEDIDLDDADDASAESNLATKCEYEEI